MSTIFQIICKTCEEDGPKIRRGARTTLIQVSVTGPYDEVYLGEAQELWTLFLGEHEFHDLRLDTGP